MNIKGIKKENKFINISAEKLKKIRKNIKIFTLAAMSGLMITSFTGCSGCSVKDEEVIEETTETVEDTTEEIVEEVAEKQEADEEIYTLQDDAVIASNNALKVGIDLSYDHVVDENDIDTYATQFTNYIIVANMDKYNDRLFAEMMIDSNVSSEDLMDSFMNLNTAFKKHLITVTNDNLYDFNNLYDKEDAEILNHAQDLIATMNENELDSDERKEAAKEFYTYATEIINSTNARMAISPQALDTLVTFIEAYDELTFNYKGKKVKGAYVDDELEHALNISKESCFGVAADSKLEVEDKVVENFKSLFRTHILTELNDKYASAKEERALQLQLGNALNELNSYSSIITYVKEHIRIDTYKKLDCDYQTWLKVLKGVTVLENGQKLPSSKLPQNGQGGVSNGQGGVISNQQLKEYGIDTTGKTDEQIRKELEEAVKADDKKKEEQNKVVTTTDETGKENPSNVITGTPEDAKNGYAAGYAAGQSGSGRNCPAGVSDAYRIAYENGYAAGEANAKKVQEQYNQETTTYEPAPVVTETTKETVETEDYKPAPTPEKTPTTNEPAPQPDPQIILPELEEEFVPADEEVIEEFEVIETVGSIGDLKTQLINYRNYLTGLNNKEIESSFKMRV